MIFLQTTSISVLSSNYTTSNTSAQDIGLTCSITPSASSSKIIVHAVLCVEGYGDRDRRPITSIHNGSVGDSTQLARLFAGEYHTGDSGSYSYGGHTYWYLDSPSTTNPVSYSIALRGYSNSYAVYCNRNHDDSRTGNDYYGRGASFITAMEVCG